MGWWIHPCTKTEIIGNGHEWSPKDLPQCCKSETYRGEPVDCDVSGDYFATCWCADGKVKGADLVENGLNM